MRSQENSSLHNWIGQPHGQDSDRTVILSVKRQAGAPALTVHPGAWGPAGGTWTSRHHPLWRKAKAIIFNILLTSFPFLLTSSLPIPQSFSGEIPDPVFHDSLTALTGSLKRLQLPVKKTKKQTLLPGCFSSNRLNIQGHTHGLMFKITIELNRQLPSNM